MLKTYFKKWIFLFAIILSTLIIGLKVAIGFFHFFFWFLVSIVLVNFIWLAIEYFGIKLHLARKVINRAEEGELLEIETFVENNSGLSAFNLVLEDNLACAQSEERKKLILIDFLRKRSGVKRRYTCRCPLRGKYRIGPLAIYFFDPLGLFFLKKTYYIYSEVFIYPRLFKIKKFPHLIQGIPPWFGIQTMRSSADEDEFFGIREYKEGDPIKRIHWLSTARKNQLIVKQFQRQTFFRATILFNLQRDKNFGEGKEKIAEYIIRIAASVAKHLIEKDIALQVIANSGEMVYIPFNKGPEHLEDIFKFLAIAQADSSVSLGEVFEDFSSRIPNDTNLVIIMPDKDWQYLPRMLPLAKRNISLVPLILVSSTFLHLFQKQEVLRQVKIKLSKMLNFTPIVFSRGDNLEEVILKY